jgi:Phosphoesterase family
MQASAPRKMPAGSGPRPGRGRRSGHPDRALRSVGIMVALAIATIAVLAAIPYVTWLATNGSTDVSHSHHGSGTRYDVGFEASGLTGQRWGVTLTTSTGVESANTTGSWIVFGAPNGSYSYAVTAPPGYQVTPATGVGTVAGQNPASVSIDFNLLPPPKYAVAFAAQGLTGQSWSVTMSSATGSKTLSSTGTSIVFQEPNGSYQYSVAPPTGFRATPASGTDAVAGRNPAAVAVTFASVGPTLYEVGFNQSGLTGPTWSVTLTTAAGSTTVSSTGVWIVFEEPNGSYSYTIISPSGFRSTPTSGVGAVAGHNPASVSVSFTPVTAATFSVVFDETGLSAQVWSVTLTSSAGSATRSSNGSSIAFSEPNGSYSYTVAAPAGYTATPPSGSVAVAGHDPPSVGVTFAPATAATYSVVFDATGLTGQTWSVTLNTSAGQNSLSSAGSSLTFTEPNGSYTYTVAAPTGYTATPSSGAVTVAGANPSAVSITFAVPTATTYTVGFDQTGLPGPTWSVTLTTSAGSNTQSATGTWIVFQEPNGSYSYTVSAPTGYAATPSSGSGTVAGQNPAAVGITFSAIVAAKYSVGFTASGLSGQSWSVTLSSSAGSSTLSSTGTSLTFSEPNGSYTFSVAAPTGYTASPSSGSVTVAGGPPAAVSLKFAVPTATMYTVGFDQTGLSGPSWSVTLTASAGSSTQSSTGTWITFSEPNGSYSYTVSAPTGYTATPSSGTGTIAGHNPASVGVTFSAIVAAKYTVGFTASGLSGQSWSVTLSSSAGTSTQSSAGSSITFSEPNGSYTYSVGAPSGYVASPGSGSVSVQGAAPSPVAVVFATGSGLPTPIQHVFLIMMENEGTDQIYGVQPYETTLANTYGWGGDAVNASGAIGYYAVCHPSAPNYLAITSGQPLQCGSDGYSSYSVNNLGNLLQTAGRSWIDYEESATSACQTSSSGEYAVKHNPFPYYSDLGGSASGSACMTHVVPIANLVNDYPYAAIPPAFTYIGPNLLNDGHDTSAAYADSWLGSFVPKLIAEPWFASSVIFIAYDESYGSNPDGGYSGLSGGPVYMVAVSPYTVGVGALGSDESHYNTLSTIEWLLGLPSTGSGHDGTAAFPAMKSLFKFPPASPREIALTDSRAGRPSPLALAAPAAVSGIVGLAGAAILGVRTRGAVRLEPAGRGPTGRGRVESSTGATGMARNRRD